MIEVDWADEQLVLLPGKAIWWPRRRTLCIADLHLGKSAAFRTAGIPVPEDTTLNILERLSHLIAAFHPQRLVFLGDLLHCKNGRHDATMDAISSWRSAHSTLDILLIRGNHDLRAGDPPTSWNFRIESEPYADEGDGRIQLAHDPAFPSPDPLVCGHIHPAALLQSAMRGMRTACFWLTDRRAILPAFGAFTGTKVVAPQASDRVFACNHESIIEVSRPRVISPRRQSTPSQ
jgi:DNA ligase-associated metallophosphoesterase